jgi:hypothetical protein
MWRLFVENIGCILLGHLSNTAVCTYIQKWVSGGRGCLLKILDAYFWDIFRIRRFVAGDRRGVRLAGLLA